MTRLWVRLIKKHRIERQMTVECAFDGAHEALDEACHALDVPRPIWLPKNERGICLLPHDRVHAGSLRGGDTL